MTGFILTEHGFDLDLAKRQSKRDFFEFVEDMAQAEGFSDEWWGSGRKSGTYKDSNDFANQVEKALELIKREYIPALEKAATGEELIEITNKFFERCANEFGNPVGNLIPGYLRGMIDHCFNYVAGFPELYESLEKPGAADAPRNDFARATGKNLNAIGFNLDRAMFWGESSLKHAFYQAKMQQSPRRKFDIQDQRQLAEEYIMEEFFPALARATNTHELFEAMNDCLQQAMEMYKTDKPAGLLVGEYLAGMIRYVELHVPAHREDMILWSRQRHAVIPVSTTDIMPHRG